MTQTSLIGSGWPELLSRLPASLDLEASARRSGALRRRRAVRDAASLLRLAFGYSVCGLSLRGAAAWAEVGAVARLSNVALLNRLRGAADWLGEIIAAILSDRLRRSAGRPSPSGLRRAGEAIGPGGRRLLVVDATTLSHPGSRKTDWRVHVGYRLGAQPCIEQLELSDGSGAESLGRFVCGAGDIVIGDRGYAKAGDLACVRECGGDFVVRTGWNATRLRTRSGAPFDLFAALARLPEQGVAEFAVAIALDRAEKRLLPARLVVRRNSEDEAARSRRRARTKSRKQGKTPQSRTLKAAGYVLLLTSLDAPAFAEASAGKEEWSAADVLDLYRLRWQIELAFKRLKSLVHLDDLPAKDPDLARCWIYAKLIAALLLEDLTGLFDDSPPCADRYSVASRFDMAHPAPAV